jgi:hypothetical protein
MPGPMPSYRVTIRYGGLPPRYEILDVSAPDLRAALADVAAVMDEAVAASADLAEIRVQSDPDEREYVGES